MMQEPSPVEVRTRLLEAMLRSGIAEPQSVISRAEQFTKWVEAVRLPSADDAPPRTPAKKAA